MMDLAGLIQLALVAFLAWGGVLFLLCLAWNVRPRSCAEANNFETDFRRVLSRRKATAAI
jgi:hypothetical protein